MHERPILSEQCENMENVLIAIHWLNILLDAASLVSVENNVIRAEFFSTTAQFPSFWENRAALKGEIVTGLVARVKLILLASLSHSHCGMAGNSSDRVKGTSIKWHLIRKV